MRHLISAVLIVAAVTFAALGQAAERGDRGDRGEPAGADRGAVGEAPAADPIEPVDGRVLAFRSSAVNSRAVANVLEILVSEGQSVKRGDVLARLDDTSVSGDYDLALANSKNTANIEQAKLQVQQMRIEVERQQALFEGSAGAKRDLELAEYNLKLAGIVVQKEEFSLAQYAVVARYKKALMDEFSVRAPFDGIVAGKFIEVGETTYPADRKIFEIIDISRVYVEVHPDISLLTRIKVGTDAAVTTPLLPGELFAGKVSFVAPTADIGGPTFKVKVLVENTEGKLRPEMKARVAFAGATGTAEGVQTSGTATGGLAAGGGPAAQEDR